jgi:hypothetical protein
VGEEGGTSCRIAKKLFTHPVLRTAPTPYMLAGVVATVLRPTLRAAFVLDLVFYVGFATNAGHGHGDSEKELAPAGKPIGANHPVILCHGRGRDMR